MSREISKAFIDDLLGGYSEHYYSQKPTHFKHLVRNVLQAAKSLASRGETKAEEECYAGIRKYVAILKQKSEVRGRELASPISEECDNIPPTEYLERICSQFEGIDSTQAKAKPA